MLGFLNIIVCIAGSVELVDISAELPDVEYQNGLSKWKVILFVYLKKTIASSIIEKATRHLCQLKIELITAV